MSEGVDLIVVQDHELAEQIMKALKHAGIHHVEFWPEHLLSDMPRRWNPLPGGIGPFHIRVSQQDLTQAQLVLTASGLVSGG